MFAYHSLVLGAFNPAISVGRVQWDLGRFPLYLDLGLGLVRFRFYNDNFLIHNYSKYAIGN